MLRWMCGMPSESQIEVARNLYALLRSKKIDRIKATLKLVHDPNNETDIDWNFNDSNKRTLLHMGVMCRDIDILSQLSKVPTSAQDDRGYTALHYAVMLQTNLDIVSHLLDRGIDLNAQSGQGHTAFDIVEALWQHQRRLKRQCLGKKLFKIIFEEGLDVLVKEYPKLDKRYKWNELLKKNPAITCFLKKNSLLLEVFFHRASLLDRGATPNRPVNLSTFVEPYFVCHGLPSEDYVYWHELPNKLSSHITVQPMTQRDKDKIICAKDPMSFEDVFDHYCRLYSRLIKPKPTKTSSTSEKPQSTATSSQTSQTITVQDKTAPLHADPSPSKYDRGRSKTTSSLESSRSSSLTISAINDRSEHRSMRGDEFSEYSVGLSSTTTGLLFTGSQGASIPDTRFHRTKGV